MHFRIELPSLFVCLVFGDRVLCVAQAGLRLRAPPASASSGLGLQVCATVTKKCFIPFLFLNHVLMIKIQILMLYVFLESVSYSILHSYPFWPFWI